MGEIHVHEFISLDGVIDAPTWTFDYGFDPKMGERIGAATERCEQTRQSLELNVTEELALSALGFRLAALTGEAA